MTPLKSLGQVHSSARCSMGAAALGGEHQGKEKYFGHAWQVMAQLAVSILSAAPLFSSSFHGAPALSADLSAGSTLLPTRHTR